MSIWHRLKSDGSACCSKAQDSPETFVLEFFLRDCKLDRRGRTVSVAMYPSSQYDGACNSRNFEQSSNWILLRSGTSAVRDANNQMKLDIRHIRSNLTMA
ncbi:hypothetical protein MRB53_037808 [Persea americana]|nr:hypothetical protein MRB53_037808 [Persea americana]